MKKTGANPSSSSSHPLPQAPSNASTVFCCSSSSEEESSTRTTTCLLSASSAATTTSCSVESSQLLHIVALPPKAPRTSRTSTTPVATLPVAPPTAKLIPTLSSSGSAGNLTSPSAITGVQRKMTTAIVTSSAALASSRSPSTDKPQKSIDVYIEGRPCIVLGDEKNIKVHNNNNSSPHCGSTDEEDDFDNDDSEEQQQQQHVVAPSRGHHHHHRRTPSASGPQPLLGQRAVAAACRRNSLTRSNTMPVDRSCGGISIISGCQQPCSPRADFLNHPPPMRLEAWCETPGTAFSVRSAKYLQTGKKQPSDTSVFSLLAVDMVKANQPMFSGLCSHPNERIQRALRREEQSGGISQLPPFVFALNLCIPGGTTTSSGISSSGYHHCVSYFGCDDISVLRDTSTPLGRLADPFFFGSSDKFRDEHFKLIPRVVEGNFIVKKAVGSKPTLLGKKLRQHYIRNERYLELVLDIGSDTIAQRIVKLAQGYAKTLHVDMMFCLEGKCPQTLPERILGGVRLKNVDFKDLDGKRICSPAPHHQGGVATTTTTTQRTCQNSRAA